MAVESLMAYNTAPSELGRTAGWFQAGNLGGSGLGGGLASESTEAPFEKRALPHHIHPGIPSTDSPSSDAL
jgi:hypothetical protein